MKEPLNKYRSKASFTPNSLHESSGEVTVTLPVEMAAFIGGILGKLQSQYTLPDGRKLDAYNAYYASVWSNTDSGCLPRGLRKDLEEIAAFGEQVIKERWPK
jgi:hypothetical protein